MNELFLKQAEIYQKYNILICYFSYRLQDNIKYRIYFKDHKNGYIHNPVIVIRDNEGKPIKYYYTGIFDSLEESLEWIIKEVENYINK